MTINIDNGCLALAMGEFLGSGSTCSPDLKKASYESLASYTSNHNLAIFSNDNNMVGKEPTVSNALSYLTSPQTSLGSETPDYLQEAKEAFAPTNSISYDEASIVATQTLPATQDIPQMWR